MTRTDTIEHLVIAFIRDQLQHGTEADIDAEANLFTSGLVDSVGAMRLIAHVESSLGIKIPPTDLVPANFRSIRVMAAYLRSRIAA